MPWGKFLRKPLKDLLDRGFVPRAQFGLSKFAFEPTDAQDKMPHSTPIAKMLFKARRNKLQFLGAHLLEDLIHGGETVDFYPFGSLLWLDVEGYQMEKFKEGNSPVQSLPTFPDEQKKSGGHCNVTHSPSAWIAFKNKRFASFSLS